MTDLSKSRTGSGLARVFLINGALLAGGLLVIELVFGNWLRPRDRIARLNLLVNTTLTYDVGRLYASHNGKALYKRDKFGLRGVYPDPAHIDILTLGGSTTDQRYISEGETWQDVLAGEFRKAGKGVSVVNAGVDGQSTYGHLKDFEWWFPEIPGLRVRYFLFYVGINDLFVDDTASADSLQKGGGFRAVLSNNSALYGLLRTLKGVSRARRYGLGHGHVDFAKVDWTEAPLADDYGRIMEERLSGYGQRLRALLEKSRQFGGRPICVTQSTRDFKVTGGRVFGRSARWKYAGREVNGVDVYHMMELLNQTTRDICRAGGATTVDLAGGLAWEDDDFYNFVHNTPRGEAKVGQFLYANLKSLFERDLAGL